MGIAVCPKAFTDLGGYSMEISLYTSLKISRHSLINY